MEAGTEGELLQRLAEVPAKIITYTIRIHMLKVLLYQSEYDKYKVAIQKRREEGKEWHRCKKCQLGPEGCKGRLKYPQGILAEPVCEGHEEVWAQH